MTVSGRPTEEQENDGTLLLSSNLDGTVVEGRLKETIEKDGTISLKFDSPEAQAKWLRQEDRRRKGLPITTTTEAPTTTWTKSTENPTWWREYLSEMTTICLICPEEKSHLLNKLNKTD